MGNIIHISPRAVSAQPCDRLDGWKSIAAYLKRDRTTVIRWARERDLPVHRLPGGRTATVFALRHELDRWIGLPDALADTPALPHIPIVAASSKPKLWLWRRLAVLALAAFAFCVPASFAIRSAMSVEQPDRNSLPFALPDNPVVSSRFLTARDLIAERTSAGLERAIVMLQQIVEATPDYAPGHATLAEALLLSREFGIRGDEALSHARAAARTATRLVPDLAIGHRMLGFIAYWADDDFAEADAQFRHSLRLDPNDPLAHFWYGNVLSDHGDHVAGLHALTQARLMQPGSIAIRTDLAWAQWAAGQDDVAIPALENIARTYPDFAVVHECLAVIALSQGDYAGYARHFARYATLKQDSAIIGKARAVEDALHRSIVDGRREIMRQALASVAQDRSRIYAALGGIHAQACPARI